MQGYNLLLYVFFLSLETRHNCVRFQVLAASSMKMRVFWDIAPCSLAGVDRRFVLAYYILHQGIIALIMDAIRTSETSVYSSETTRRYIPEDSSSRLNCVFTFYPSSGIVAPPCRPSTHIRLENGSVDFHEIWCRVFLRKIVDLCDFD
jgi:hypothetical protein